MLFKLLWLFDALVALVASGSFIFYLLKGPVSKAITHTWISLLMLLAAMMLSAGWLQIIHCPTPAWILLVIMASPGLVYLVLVLALNVFGLKL